MAGEIVCGRCGASFSRLSSLKRHRAERRCPGRAALVPASPRLRRLEAIRAEVLDVTPTRSEIVPAKLTPARPGRALVQGPIFRPDSLDGEGPPSWWEPQADPEWRRTVWAGFPADYRNGLLAVRVGAAFTIRPPDGEAEVILWSQYHALKALATRLDAGIGTERERASFGAGLREYNANYDRIAAQRKALPG